MRLSLVPAVLCVYCRSNIWLAIFPLEIYTLHGNIIMESSSVNWERFLLVPAVSVFFAWKHNHGIQFCKLECDFCWCQLYYVFLQIEYMIGNIGNVFAIVYIFSSNIILQKRNCCNTSTNDMYGSRSFSILPMET